MAHGIKKSFFERSYILTLVLFLVLLNGGIFGLALYSYRTSTEAAKQVCIAEQVYIAEAFETDLNNKGSGGDELLLLSYGTFYAAKNIDLCFERYGETVYTNIPSEYILPEKDILTVKKYSGKRILLIRKDIAHGKYVMTYSKDISYLDDELMHLLTVFVTLSVAVSAIMAVLLYFVQRKLYLPLKKLQAVTNEIAGGNLLSRADEAGEDEFSLLARDFNAMADKISAQMEELRDTADKKQELLDNLAHEMRTPLTSIHGYAELAFGNDLTEEERMKALSAIMSESMRLKDISRALLDISYLREKGINKKTVDVKNIVESVCRRFKTVCGENTEIDCESEDIFISGDATLLEELISNLTENAVKAVNGSGKIFIGAHKDGFVTEIFVTDTGKGMTKDQLSHITEPFYRTDSARTRSLGGTGLGLALCKKIAEAHGGELVFESFPGKGTKAAFVIKN